MSASQEALIVVGVDGSPSSIKALEWAIGQAALTHAPIEAVIGWHYPQSYGVPLPDTANGGDLAAETLTKAIATARNARPAGPEAAVPISSFVAEGHPAQILLDRSADASLLVVGSRGHGGFAEALLGSVSQHVVHHAPCPVVVIRDREA
ncbi:MAG TPA: universal stress protein [Streptosporangiaceae bacterium]|nr:universal stress protein [Streptosporangiaceae bacterium]